MGRLGRLSAMALGALASGFAGTALAQPVLDEPASALVYPLFDSTPSHGTLITVTNTNTSRVRTTCNNNGFAEGDICVLYTYFGFDRGRSFCREFNTTECLTPGDTLTVIADQHNPEMEIGWLWVEARDPETGRAVDFDYLIGSAIVVNTGTDFLFEYHPYGFRALPGTVQRPTGETHDACGRDFTDLDNDGFADFDGVEYDFWPATLYLDEFFQQGGTNPSFSNELTLASCDVDPFDSDDTRVAALIWNNRERAFSRSFNFECQFKAPLSDISNVVNNLGGDPNELVLGARSIQAGWLSLVGSDAILGVFFQRVNANPALAAGHELQFSGQFGGPEDPNSSHYPCSLPRVD
ncbi:MAG: hypothetical protein HYR85_03810 [Planctomycetes bacterium]|nr:hypothetical protein [Planctomycetota bacterium]MBI3848502.1 hypothetical protein [Planctomycetota bacterium]